MANSKNAPTFLARIAILLGLTVRDLAVLLLHLLATVARLPAAVLRQYSIASSGEAFLGRCPFLALS
jgi:hypothetical protein